MSWEDVSFGLRLLFLVMIGAGCILLLVDTVADTDVNKMETSPPKWLVVQYRADGTPFGCWPVSHTKGRGPLYLDDKVPARGPEVSVSAQLVRVATQGKPEEAAKRLGINYDACKGGVYPFPKD